jgi:hypothetical protein
MKIAQNTCKMTESILKYLKTVKIIVMKYKQTKMSVFISIYTCFMYASKIYLSYYFESEKLLIPKLPVIASAILFATEHLLFVLCFEIKEHLKYINCSLKNSTKSAHQVEKLCHAFEKIIDAQEEINCEFGPFLFLNLSQLFLNMLHVPVALISSCVHITPNNLNCSPIKWFAISMMLVIYFTRFALICWFCGITNKEVFYYSIKITNLTIKLKKL